MDKNLVGGSSNMMILSLLSRKEMYGYEIIKELELLSKTVFQFKEGTLYPILYRLEKNGYLTSMIKIAESGKERRYYAITVSGQHQLANEKKQWESFQSSVNSVLGGHYVLN
jgi:PadR family transcriptional regulator, regulatory protein PadR